MRIRFTPLFKSQLDSLARYIRHEFGYLVAERVATEISLQVQDILPFISKYPLYFIYRGYEVHRIANRKNYIFYTTKDDTLWVLAIFDTRMSPSTIRAMIMRQVRVLRQQPRESPTEREAKPPCRRDSA